MEPVGHISYIIWWKYGCHVGVIWASYEDHIESYGVLMVSYGDHIINIINIINLPQSYGSGQDPPPLEDFHKKTLFFTSLTHFKYYLLSEKDLTSNLGLFIDKMQDTWTTDTKM